LGSCGVVLDASNGAALARSLDDAKKRLKETAGGTPTDGVHSADALFRGVATRAMSEAQVSLFVYLFICLFVYFIGAGDSIDAVFCLCTVLRHGRRSAERRRRARTLRPSAGVVHPLHLADSKVR